MPQPSKFPAIAHPWTEFPTTIFVLVGRMPAIPIPRADLYWESEFDAESVHHGVRMRQRQGGRKQFRYLQQARTVWRLARESWHLAVGP